MLTPEKKENLLQKMQNIFQINNLTNDQIIALLDMSEADYTDERFDKASDQIAELVGEERLSFDVLMLLIKLCREAVEKSRTVKV